MKLIIKCEHTTEWQKAPSPYTKVLLKTKLFKKTTKESGTFVRYEGRIEKCIQKRIKDIVSIPLDVTTIEKLLQILSKIQDKEHVRIQYQDETIILTIMNLRDYY